MIKKLFFLAGSLPLFAGGLHQEQEKTVDTISKSTVWPYVVVGAGVVGAAVVAGPVVLPAATITAVKTTAAVVTAKCAAAGTSIKAATAIAVPLAHLSAPFIGSAQALFYGARYVKQYFFPTNEQKLTQLLVEEAQGKPFEEQMKEALERKRGKNI